MSEGISEEENKVDHPHSLSDFQRCSKKGCDCTGEQYLALSTWVGSSVGEVWFGLV